MILNSLKHSVYVKIILVNINKRDGLHDDLILYKIENKKFFKTIWKHEEPCWKTNADSLYKYARKENIRLTRKNKKETIELVICAVKLSINQ